MWPSPWIFSSPLPLFLTFHSIFKVLGKVFIENIIFPSLHITFPPFFCPLLFFLPFPSVFKVLGKVSRHNIVKNLPQHLWKCFLPFLPSHLFASPLNLFFIPLSLFFFPSFYFSRCWGRFQGIILLKTFPNTFENILFPSMCSFFLPLSLFFLPFPSCFKVLGKVFKTITTF